MPDAKKWIRPEIQQMNAYHVPTVGADVLKLDAMELPQDMPPALKKAWVTQLENIALNRYPLPHNEQLAGKLRAQFAIPADKSIIFGNGSDEFIQILQIAIAGAGRKILAPTPSFVMYEIVAQLLGLEFVGVDLRSEDFSLDLPAMLAAIEAHQPAIIFLACPNNPTGNLFARDEVEAIIRAASGLVVLDEAYHAYASTHYSDFVEKYKHVVVMRTLSKVGFAGLRFGYLFGAPEWVGELDKVRPPYNINVLTQASIEFVLDHYEQIAPQATQIVTERERLFSALKTLPHCKVWPSQANFLLLRTPQADEVFQALKAENILIKNQTKAHPLLKDCLRITVSNEEENSLLFKALQNYFSS